MVELETKVGSVNWTVQEETDIIKDKITVIYSDSNLADIAMLGSIIIKNNIKENNALINNFERNHADIRWT